MVSVIQPSKNWGQQNKYTDRYTSQNWNQFLYSFWCSVFNSRLLARQQRNQYQVSKGFVQKKKKQEHIKDRNLSIYIHIRNVKKVWKSDKIKKFPKIKALILLKFPCLVKDSCPNCHPLPVFIFHLSVRHLKSCGDLNGEYTQQPILDLNHWI